MKISNKVCYLIAGVVCVVALLPILQSVTDVLCGVLEVVKSKLNIFIVRNNLEINEMNPDECEKNAIGFSVASPIESDEDDEEENKFHVGFGGNYR